MAWKMRKDKPLTAAPEEETGLADTAVPEESLAEATPQPLEETTFDPQSHPFVMPPSDEERQPLYEETVVASPTVEFSSSEAPSPLEAKDVEEPQFLAAEPQFTDDYTPQGPFAPFQPEQVSADPSPVFPTSLDRDQVAPGLVHTDWGSDVPRVAPFIVDVPPTAAPDVAMTGTLTVRIGNFTANFQITKDVTLIGRPDSLLQSYPDVEIELDDAVSRRHAEIRRHDSGYFLVDTRSTNGTILNGERLDPHREYPLNHGDRIHLGDRTEIIFD